tara:strand:+ start:798 stop:2324 length:1527 start_codon:yes stop_codon:yes gene_type:complete
MKNILIYSSQYEHINRGLLDYIENTYRLAKCKILLITCDNEISNCYLNHRLSNIDKIEHYNNEEACQTCINNQRSFIDYSEELAYKISEVKLSKEKYLIEEDRQKNSEFIEEVKEKFEEDLTETHLNTEDYLIKSYGSQESAMAIVRSAIGEYVSSIGTTDYINWNIVSNKIFEAKNIYKQIADILVNEKIEKVFVFNGRFMNASIIIQAAKNNKIEFDSFESGHSWGPYSSSYSIVKNGAHQDFDARAETLYNYFREKELLSQYKEEDGIIQGKKMLYDRIFNKKQSGNYKLFVTNKFREDSIDKGEYVLFLHTSLFEFYVTRDYLKGGKSDQVAAMEELCKVLGKLKMKLILRFHPNSRGSDERFKERLIKAALKYNPKTEIYHSEDLVDTYKLMQGAKVVLGTSTMGIVESIFCSVPSYYFSPAIYSRYLPTRHLNIHQESPRTLMDAIINPNKILISEIRNACLYYAEYNWLFNNINFSNTGIETRSLRIPHAKNIRKYGHYTK